MLSSKDCSATHTLNEFAVTRGRPSRQENGDGWAPEGCNIQLRLPVLTAYYPEELGPIRVLMGHNPVSTVWIAHRLVNASDAGIQPMAEMAPASPGAPGRGSSLRSPYRIVATCQGPTVVAAAKKSKLLDRRGRQTVDRRGTCPTVLRDPIFTFTLVCSLLRQSDTSPEPCYSG